MVRCSRGPRRERPGPRRNVAHDGQAVGERLEAFFDTRSRHAGAYDRHFRQLWDLAHECAFGGKLVRPVLLIDMYDALSDIPDPDVHEKLLDLETAVELLHFAFLLHDDVIDGDDATPGDLTWSGASSPTPDRRRLRPDVNQGGAIYLTGHRTRRR